MWLDWKVYRTQLKEEGHWPRKMHRAHMRREELGLGSGSLCLSGEGVEGWPGSQAGSTGLGPPSLGCSLDRGVYLHQMLLSKLDGAGHWIDTLPTFLKKLLRVLSFTNLKPFFFFFYWAQ